MKTDKRQEMPGTRLVAIILSVIGGCFSFYIFSFIANIDNIYCHAIISLNTLDVAK